MTFRATAILAQLYVNISIWGLDRSNEFLQRSPIPRAFRYEERARCDSVSRSKEFARAEHGSAIWLDVELKSSALKLTALWHKSFLCVREDSNNSLMPIKLRFLIFTALNYCTFYIKKLNWCKKMIATKIETKSIWIENKSSKKFLKSFYSLFLFPSGKLSVDKLTSGLGGVRHKIAAGRLRQSCCSKKEQPCF